MKEIVDSYFQTRSLVNHQLMSYNDTILGGEGRKSRMEKIVRNIRVGTDEPVELIPVSYTHLTLPTIYSV